MKTQGEDVIYKAKREAWNRPWREQTLLPSSPSEGTAILILFVSRTVGQTSVVEAPTLVVLHYGPLMGAEQEQTGLGVHVMPPWDGGQESWWGIS